MEFLQCIKIIWGWINTNSGVIQVLIAILAIVYAVKGYQKILQQLNFSQNQEKQAFKQRELDIKIQCLNLSIAALNKNASKLDHLNELVSLVNQTIDSHDENSEVTIDNLNELLETIETKLKESEEVHEEITVLSNAININRISDHEEGIKNLYKLLIEITHDDSILRVLKHSFIPESD